MVTLLVPRAGEERYVFFRSFAVGPYDQLMRSDGEGISLPSALSVMTQTRGIYGENNVEHSKVEGDIVYHPLLGGAVKIPTSSIPIYSDRVKFPVYNSTGGETWITADNGLAIDRVNTFAKLSATTWRQHAIERVSKSPSLWRVYCLSGMTNPIRFTEAYTYEMTSLNSISATSLFFGYTQKVYKYYQMDLRGINWDVKQSFDEVVKCFSDLLISTKVSGSTNALWYKARIPSTSTFSTIKAKEHIDAIAQQLVPNEYPIPEVPYGDLAMKASEKVNANRVNMIAFLRDLRHPTEMIPKLRNLTKLKTLADNYLTVSYGILPTISDIQTIVGAFKSKGPYFDKNGFQTYSAGSLASIEKDGNTYTQEQHIKVAIGDDDTGILALIKRLDSMGTLPTFKNLWDLVPYSFVIDWLIDVGDFLARIDTCLRLTRLGILYVTSSRKRTSTGLLTWDNQNCYVGSVKLEQYHRWVTDQCPVPPLSLKETFPEFDHWLESSALFVQRAKR